MLFDTPEKKNRLKSAVTDWLYVWSKLSFWGKNMTVCFSPYFAASTQGRKYWSLFSFKAKRDLDFKQNLLKLSQNISAASCKKDIILASMTNKYSALLILLGLYYLSPNGFPSPYLLSCQSGYRLGKLWSSSKIGQTADSKFN